MTAVSTCNFPPPPLTASFGTFLDTTATLSGSIWGLLLTWFREKFVSLYVSFSERCQPDFYFSGPWCSCLLGALITLSALVLGSRATSRLYLEARLRTVAFSLCPHSAGDTQGSLTQKPQGKLVESLIPPTSLPSCPMALDPESHFRKVVGQPWEACCWEMYDSGTVRVCSHLSWVAFCYYYLA